MFPKVIILKVKNNKYLEEISAKVSTNVAC